MRLFISMKGQYSKLNSIRENKISIFSFPGGFSKLWYNIYVNNTD